MHAEPVRHFCFVRRDSSTFLTTYIKIENFQGIPLDIPWLATVVDYSRKMFVCKMWNMFEENNLHNNIHRFRNGVTISSILQIKVSL